MTSAEAADALEVLVVDDEEPALEDLAYLLRQHPRIGAVVTASDATEALRRLRDGSFAAVFLDIRMPGLDGLELARVLSRFARPPEIVFVTAFEQHAVEAFELQAVDYLLKPVRPERLSDAIRRLGAGTRPAVPGSGAGSGSGGAGDDDLDRIAVETGGRTRMVDRDSIRFVEASGDYVRLHTDDGAHLVRMPISVLEEAWRDAGFVRVHRGYLIALRHVSELRTRSGGGYDLVVAGQELPVSRRHARELRDRLSRVPNRYRRADQ
ncbi:MAG TPA: LytTR family DNA-binding domain-containing protein [Acidimicrobiia bacterium]|nr:LytTR family DNA-binding domain-containing protein [Acidimicrobiia bacterium]